MKARLDTIQRFLPVNFEIVHRKLIPASFANGIRD